MVADTRRTRPGVPEQRRRLLAAARVLMAARGAGDVSVTDLVQQAGVSRATFYRCFTGVDAVVEALYREFFDLTQERLERNLRPGVPVESSLRGVVGEVLGDAVTFGPYLRALFREEIRADSPFGAAQDSRVEVQVRYICGWWESWAPVPADSGLVRAIVLLLQASGLFLARTDVTDAERTSMEDSVVFMIEATIGRYLAAHRGS